MSSTVNRIAAVGVLVVAARLPGCDMQNRNPEPATTSSNGQEQTASKADGAQNGNGDRIEASNDP